MKEPSDHKDSDSNQKQEIKDYKKFILDSKQKLKFIYKQRPHNFILSSKFFFNK